MAYAFTSIRHASEKLQEAEYFLGRIASAAGLEFQFNLNAFLSACRSVTFVLQKSMAAVPGFASWYDEQRREMKGDAAMGFFLELRNISQHEGPVSYVTVSLSRRERPSYRFAGNHEAVPADLLGTEIVSACANHLAKLARLLCKCFLVFQFYCCPVRAMSLEGMGVLGYTLVDVGNALGFPPGYMEAGGDIPMSEVLRILSREFEPLDIGLIERIARADLRIDGITIDIPVSIMGGLIDAMADLVDSRDGSSAHPRTEFVSAVMRMDNVGSENQSPENTKPE
jgi:hypothetical protein